MAEWTIHEVAARFAEAAETARSLPPARVQGYVNMWPALLRAAPERHAAEVGRYHVQPSPVAIDRMLEVMRWVQWLDAESRHIVWMRADHYEWQQICRKIGCDRTTAWRKWKRGLMTLSDHLSRVS